MNAISPGNARKPAKPPITFKASANRKKRDDELWWSDERLAILKDGCSVGLSYSQIARKVGNGCTRNAALGKARRMGFTQPGEPSRPTRLLREPPVRGVNPVSKDAPARVKIAAHGAYVEAPPRPPRMVVPFRQEAPGLRVLMTVERGECRWPIGDPQDSQFTLCGCKAEAGPYCTEHGGRAFTSEATRKRVDRKLGIEPMKRFAAE